MNKIFVHKEDEYENMWNKIPLASKIGLLLEVIALIALLVMIGLGKQVPRQIFDVFLAGLVIVMLSNIYHRNQKR